MSRSLKKGPYLDERLLAKLRRLKAADKTVVKTWSRAAIITPEMVGYTIGVHNGKTHLPVRVIENMVGHRLGEFAPTRTFTRHGGKMQKELEAEKAATAAAPAAAPAAGEKGEKK
ncbi:30S ribosomal protein S19 [Patescibacteria group bacterium]|nr:MAG: 30S ribosomal protein S19 [Patescibacteria group bacterium]